MSKLLAPAAVARGILVAVAVVAMDTLSVAAVAMDTLLVAAVTTLHIVCISLHRLWKALWSHQASLIPQL